MAGIFFFLRKSFAVPVGCQIKLAAYYRFYFGLPVFVFVFVGFGYKFKDTKHIAMIADCHRGHTIGDGLFVKVLYRGRSVEE
jgi:hypothetical protein